MPYCLRPWRKPPRLPPHAGAVFFFDNQWNGGDADGHGDQPLGCHHRSGDFLQCLATYCDNSAIIGTAQLTSAGTEIIKRVPGIGSHSYTAVFHATTANATSTQLDATASTPGTFVYTPAAGTIPAVGTDTLAVTFTPTDTADYTTATASVSLTVNRGAPSTITAVSGPSQSAHVNLAFGTPMQASVKDVANDPVPGVAATANFALTNTVAPDYSIVVNPSTVTIVQGQSGSTTFTLTPVGGFSGTVTLNCAGLPSFGTCTFVPASAVMNGSNTPVTVQLTIATSVATSNAVRLDPPNPLGPLPGLQTFLLLAGLALLCSPGWKHQRRRMQRFGMVAMLLLAAITMSVALIGCGGTSSTALHTTPAGTYSSSVTATASASAGGASHTANVTIIIIQ